jgi:hypothetical protein
MLGNKECAIKSGKYSKNRCFIAVVAHCSVSCPLYSDVSTSIVTRSIKHGNNKKEGNSLVKCVGMYRDTSSNGTNNLSSTSSTNSTLVTFDVTFRVAIG